MLRTARNQRFERPDRGAVDVEISRLGTVEATFEPLVIDSRVGRAIATVAWTVKGAGAQPRARVMDLWIAATALAHKIPLYTRNAEDFRLLHEILEVRPV